MNSKSMMFLTFILVLVCSMCVGSQAMGKSVSSDNCGREYTRQIEKEYIEGVRNTLEDLGYHNAGISMNRVVDDQVIEYTLNIHHRKIDNMDEMQREELSDIILLDELFIENASVRVKYIN